MPIPNNEFSEQFTGDMPSMDTARHNELNMELPAAIKAIVSLDPKRLLQKLQELANGECDECDNSVCQVLRVLSRAEVEASERARAEAIRRQEEWVREQEGKDAL